MAILLLIVIICALYFIGKNKRGANTMIKDENVETKTDYEKNDKEIKAVIENDEIKEIIKFKKEKYSSYRNYPNQTNLKQIYRRKPKYLSRYVFSNINLDSNKLEVEKSKYDLIAEREERFFNKKPLPSTYFKNEIVLIPKNTNTLFTYWEVREDTFNDIKNNHQLVSENPLIILKDIDGSEKLKIFTYSRNGSMYINNVDPNHDYTVILGFLDIYDNFIELAYSNSANVPSPTPSDNFDVKWGVAETKMNEFGNISIDFKTLNKDNINEYLGFKQEVLDDDVLTDNEKSINYRNDLNFDGSSNFNGSSFLGSSNLN